MSFFGIVIKRRLVYINELFIILIGQIHNYLHADNLYKLAYAQPLCYAYIIDHTYPSPPYKN